MVVIPKQQPVLENLNIFYLDVRKLLEHFQGEIGSGGIHFKSHAAEGVIFFDQDKSVVSQQKANFLSRYHGHKAYIDYVAPNYRVRIGNFRTKLEAEALKAELLTYFPTAVVVEDYIQLPELPAANSGE